MNGLRLVVLALFAVASVHSLPKLDTSDMSMQQLMTKVKGQIPASNDEEATALLHKFSAMLDDIDIDASDFSADSSEEIAEIGPDFKLKQYIGQVARYIDQSWNKRCEKISGDNKAYIKDEKAQEEFETCFENWDGFEEFEKSYNHTQETGDYKSMFKSVCKSRSGFFECTDKYVSAMSYCYFPSEREIVNKVDRFNKNFMNLFCAYEEDNFELFEMDGEGMKCVKQSKIEIKTCANKALYAVTERFLAKWIENEHFSYAMEPEDCAAFDEIKSCFVSSVENCTNPKVKDLFASMFQLMREQTKC